MLVRWQPDVIYGYASVLSLFARFLKENKITGIRPKLIDSTSEKLSGPQRELLREVFQCKVIDDYSSRELGIMAFECETGEFLVTADVRYLEVVANDQVVPIGEMGEVAITSTYQFSWPFIRYKDGDMAIYEAETSKSGRPFPVLKEIVGRTNDFLVTSENKFVHSEFFAYTFRIKPEVLRYQIYQPDKQHLDIRLVCNQAVSHAWLEAARAEVQSRFGPATQITVRVVDDIPLTPAGKHRFIVSEITPDFSSTMSR
jgi:phenylacetate-CoA ligase